MHNSTITNIVHRHDDTIRIIKHWHPWLSEDYSGMNSGHRSSASNLAVEDALSSEALEHIRQHNALDIELYNFAMRRFDMQMKVLNDR